MAPRSDHLLLELQPAMRNEITTKEVRAAIKISAMLRSCAINVGPKGMTINTAKAGAKATIGARTNTHRSTPLGMISSLEISLMTSASDWMIPWGPVLMGP